jgi:hypothetical protein
MFCEAYPGGIPEEIVTNQWDHRVQQAGDHGLQFVPEDPDEGPMPWWPEHHHDVHEVDEGGEA